jgi:hypothetical protein
MDFEEELRKFARSDMPLRQMRESARWQIEIWTGNECLIGEARDVSRGGLGAIIEPDSVWQARLVVGYKVRLLFLWADEDSGEIDPFFARVIWVRKNEKAWDIGFEFYDLDDRAEAYIARYLLTRVVTRYLDDNSSS